MAADLNALASKVVENAENVQNVHDNATYLNFTVKLAMSDKSTVSAGNYSVENKTDALTQADIKELSDNIMATFQASPDTSFMVNRSNDINNPFLIRYTYGNVEHVIVEGRARY